MKSGLSLLFLLWACIIQAQSTYPELESYFNRLAEREKAMGSVCVRQNGKILFQKSFGYASIDPSIKADSLTIYQVGSISKTFTAVIILQMEEEGKLKLQDKLSRFFPDWPQASQTTIEHLLRHQSGIHNFGKDLSRKYRDVKPETTEEIKAVFRNSKPDFRPGQKTEYNNANYIALSLIAEELDGISFAQIVKQRITAPTGLTRTYLGDSIEPEKGEAYSFYYRKGWQENFTAHYGKLMGAGGVASTPTELCKFFETLFRAELFSAEALEQMVDMQENMGLGIFSYPFGSQRCYGHSGNVDSFESMAAYFPEQKLAFAVCLNANRTDFNQLLIKLLELFVKP